MTAPTSHPGLEGVIAADTRISMVDGQAGELIIAGYPLSEIAEQATFEELLHLLWYDTLPDRDELASITAALARHRTLPAATLAVLRAGAGERIPVMDALAMAAGTLRLEQAGAEGAGPADSRHHPRSGQETLAFGIVARFPTIIAAYTRLLHGREPVEPKPDLGHAANYLTMLTDAEPTTDQVRALDTYLCTVSDHGLNASTFAARVIVSTRSDLLSAIVGALGALKGPLHGGAPGPALDMVFEIGSMEQAEPILRARLERGERLMGFGHRVYKVRDPRADVLGAAAARLFRTDGDQALYELARHVERTALRLLEEFKPGRRLQTNVEFYTALLLHGIGLPTDLFTPTFAMGRAAGWIAHCLEQQRLDRLIRPQSSYSGERDRKWTPLGRRLKASGQ